jgi:hypothetical protein
MDIMDISWHFKNALADDSEADPWNDQPGVGLWPEHHRTNLILTIADHGGVAQRTPL